jgi:uncharacterized spore protein YtfJ
MSRLIQSGPTAGKAIAQIEAAMTAGSVFGDPIEKHGITVLPVGRVIAGAGRGGGDGKSRGWGAGFGVISEPLGVYVIDGAGAQWVPVAARNLLFAAAAQPIELLRKLLFSAAAIHSRPTPRAGNTAPTKAKVPKKRPVGRVPRGGVAERRRASDSVPGARARSTLHRHAQSEHPSPRHACVRGIPRKMDLSIPPSTDGRSASDEYD